MTMYRIITIRNEYTDRQRHRLHIARKYRDQFRALNRDRDRIKRARELLAIPYIHGKRAFTPTQIREHFKTPRPCTMTDAEAVECLRQKGWAWTGQKWVKSKNLAELFED